MLGCPRKRIRTLFGNENSKKPGGSARSIKLDDNHLMSHLQVTGKCARAGPKDTQSSFCSFSNLIKTDRPFLIPKKQSIVLNKSQKYQSCGVQFWKKQKDSKDSLQEHIPLKNRQIRKKVISPKLHLLKIQNLVEENRQLSSKVTELQTYFQKIGVREASKDSNENQNLRLKILLQQQKIASLVFIIKQQRQGNKAEFAIFQRKVASYEPTLQRELTEKIAEINGQLMNTNNDLQMIRALFQSAQAETHSSNKQTWDHVLESIAVTQKQNHALRNENAELKHTLRIQQNQKQDLLTQNNLCKKTISKLQTQVKELEIYKDELTKVGSELDSIKHSREQDSYELNAKACQIQILEQKCRLNQDTAFQLGRLQSQNITLKNKLLSLTRDFNDKIFQQASLVKRLSLLQKEITENKMKFVTGLALLKDTSITSELFEERLTFIQHLFSKNLSIHDRIILDYRAQFESLYTEAQKASTMAKGLAAELEQSQSRAQNIKQKTIAVADKLTKYMAQLKGIQDECKNCSSVKGIYQQINFILESIGNFPFP